MTLTDEVQQRLITAMDAYDAQHSVDDEIFHEVSDRIAQSGDAGKMDIAAITLWKRSGQGKWVKPLLATAETGVRTATRAAFAADDDRVALDALAVLGGFAAKGPLVTALLCAADPEKYAVMDRRARQGLELVDRGVEPGDGATLRYLERVREIRDDVRKVRPDTTARDVDKALFVLGASAGAAKRAASS